jgi:aminoglycoside phosphotransferase (APT) family kinase protein
MARLAHGYTNVTTRDGDFVTKTYAGPDALERQAREERAIAWVRRWLPVPQIVASEPGSITTRYVSGEHGQDLLESACTRAVLPTCGRLLRDLQSLPLPAGTEAAPGTVLVHGDFGPNNALLTADATAVILLADWEWSDVGSPHTDLAWCEFIVREHHPHRVGQLDGLFDAYGDRPAWGLRQAAMLERARSHLDMVRRWRGGPVQVWEQRISRIQQWDGG